MPQKCILKIQQEIKSKIDTQFEPEAYRLLANPFNWLCYVEGYKILYKWNLLIKSYFVGTTSQNGGVPFTLKNLHTNLLLILATKKYLYMNQKSKLIKQLLSKRNIWKRNKNKKKNNSHDNFSSPNSLCCVKSILT